MPLIIGKSGIPASGGVIKLLDTGYYLHTFTESGTFTTNSLIIADILVVGGGGGAGAPGGHGRSGGAAAAGVFTRKWQVMNGSLSFPVTVGAAGLRGTPLPEKAPSGTTGGVSQFNSPSSNGVPALSSITGGVGGISGGAGPNTGGGEAVRGINNPIGSGSGGSGGNRWGFSNPSIGISVDGFGYPGSGGAPTWGGGGGGGAYGSANQNVGGNGLPISSFTSSYFDYAAVGGSGETTATFPWPRNPQATNSPTKYGNGGNASPTGVSNDPQYGAGPGAVLIKYAV